MGLIDVSGAQPLALRWQTANTDTRQRVTVVLIGRVIVNSDPRIRRYRSRLLSEIPSCRALAPLPSHAAPSRYDFSDTLC